MALHELDTQMYIGQKAFIRRGEDVLVLRDEIGIDFPGGKYRWGNDLKEELQREVTEETTLEIKVGDPFVTWTNFGVSGAKADVFYVGYLCDYVLGEVELSDEHIEFEWVNKSNYKKWEDPTGHFKALEKYFELNP